MATLLSDNFDRANSTSVVGSPQIGPAPTVLSGTLGISSNALYASAVAGDGAMVVWDLATPDVEFTFQRDSLLGTMGVIFCAASATDYIYAECPAGGMTLSRRKASPETAPQPLVGAFWGGALGDTFTVSMKSGIFRGWANGRLVIRYPVQDYVASNRHGFKFSATTGTKVPSVTVVDSSALTPTMPETGALADPARFATPTPTPTSFLYRGRDSASLDTAGVA